MIIEIAIIIGSILDLILTYNYLKIYKEKFPEKDFVVIEANPLIRYCVRTLGLKEGIFRSGFIILPILIALIYILPINWRYFLAGIYYTTITFHLTNFFAIRWMKGGKK